MKKRELDLVRCGRCGCYMPPISWSRHEKEELEDMYKTSIPIIPEYIHLGKVLKR